MNAPCAEMCMHGQDTKSSLFQTTSRAATVGDPPPPLVCTLLAA